MENAISINVFNTEDGLMNFLLEKWRELASGAVNAKGRFSVALSGGKTPVAFYRELACVEGSLPWNKTHIFLVDERVVPYSHPDSNFGMIAGFLNSVAIPLNNFHPMPTGGASPELYADKYEHELRSYFGVPGDGIPEFDLILLGLGDDGHTASLFPGDAALDEAKRLAVPVFSGEPKHDRITLTLPLINKAENVILLVRGSGKAAILGRLIKGKDRALPAARVKPDPGKLLLAADREAAAAL